MIDDDHELDRILESTNLDKRELIDLPMEQPKDLSHKHMGVGMALNLDTVLRYFNGTDLGVDPCQGSFLPFPPLTNSYTRHEK